MMRMASTSRSGHEVRMVAGTESMVVMDREACFEPVVSARRSVEDMGSKGAVALSWERQASGGWSVEASEAARVRSSGRVWGTTAGVVAVVVVVVVVVAVDEEDDDVDNDAAAGSMAAASWWWALGGSAMSLPSTWPGPCLGGAVGFPLAW
jgi:hypothetical protein